jgi:hypothetical protein
MNDIFKFHSTKPYPLNQDNFLSGMASFVDTLSVGKTALILIEFQNEFTTEGY